jgi:cell division septation protein DedD
MNDLLKQRIGRLLDSLSDERGYQILDFIEFLDSKYAERGRPSGILAKITETVEDTMRAGKPPIQAISGTMGIMDGAAKVMKGLAAAGQAVVDEAVKAAEQASKPSDQVAAPAPPAVPPTTQQSGTGAQWPPQRRPSPPARPRRSSSAASARWRRSLSSSAP